MNQFRLSNLLRSYFKTTLNPTWVCLPEHIYLAPSLKTATWAGGHTARCPLTAGFFSTVTACAPSPCLKDAQKLTREKAVLSVTAAKCLEMPGKIKTPHWSYTSTDVSRAACPKFWGFDSYTAMQLLQWPKQSLSS